MKKNQPQIGRIFYDHIRALQIAEEASAKNLSIFSLPLFLDVKEQFGKVVQQPVLPPCQGSLDIVESIDSDTHFLRVGGWLFDPTSKASPQIIRFLDRQGTMVGYALTGQPRIDVALAIDKQALRSGYKGYLLSDDLESELTLQGESPSCQMQAKLPQKSALAEVNNQDVMLSDLLQISGALKAFKQKHGVYPQSVGFDGFKSNWGESSTDWIKGLSPDFLQILPRDPRKSKEPNKQYLYKSDGKDYKLIVHGVNAKAALLVDYADPKRPTWAAGVWTPGAANW